MASWRAFSTHVLRSLPRTATMAERQRALRAAGSMWRAAKQPVPHRSAALRRNPSDGSLLLWGVGALAAYLWVVRPHQSRLVAWLTPPAKG